MSSNRKLLFIHNSFPAYGASGNVVFLRHFMNLGLDWQIHIAVPERLKDKIPDYFPVNFYLHFIPDRKWFWPPFREKNGLLRNIRNQLWQIEINRIIKSINGVDAIVTAMSHYMAVSAIELAYKKNIRSIIFLHDRWDLQNKNTDRVLRTIRIAKGKNTLLKASVIFTVSRELALHYGEDIGLKARILYPIPHVSAVKAQWQDKFSNQTILVHTGTIDKFSIHIFDYFADKIMAQKDKLELVYVWMDFLDELLKKYPEKIEIVEFFKKNEDAISYVATNVSAMLVYYGLDNEENIFAMDSFPSRFIEFVQTGIPIICIAPESSAFYKFLKAEDWPLLYSKQNVNDLNNGYAQLALKNHWEEFARKSVRLALNKFDASAIQNEFETALQDTQTIWNNPKCLFSLS